MSGDLSETEYTKSAQSRKPSITLWCIWIITWYQIDPAAIIKSCCISNALDGSENSILYEDQDTSEGSDPFEDLEEEDPFEDM